MITTLANERLVQANYGMSTTFPAIQLFDKHTEATPSYEIITMNDIVLNTSKLNEAIAKFSELSIR